MGALVQKETANLPTHTSTKSQRIRRRIEEPYRFRLAPLSLATSVRDQSNLIGKRRRPLRATSIGPSRSVIPITSLTMSNQVSSTVLESKGDEVQSILFVLSVSCDPFEQLRRLSD